MNIENERGKKGNTVVILDFGSQVGQLIASRCRKAKVYSEVLPFNTPISKILAYHPVGIFFTGGPKSVYEEGAPKAMQELVGLGIPIMGICYGHQLMAHMLGGKVSRGVSGEYGPTEMITMNTEGTPHEGIGKTKVIMSHGDQVIGLPPGFEVIAQSQKCPIAGMINRESKFVSVQYHPEVEHSKDGQKVIDYFLKKMCGATGQWTPTSLKERAITYLREQVGNDYLLVACSGGVDSTVLAVVSHLALGDHAIPVFVNNGLLRKNEHLEVPEYLRKAGVNVIVEDAAEEFLEALVGVVDPEQKRKIIGGKFIEIFIRRMLKIQAERGIIIKCLGQGTLYPDVIESISAHGGPTDKIKSHHNVGGLPDKLIKEYGIKLVEPFREIFKDEVRLVGEEVGLPKTVTGRHPFPGPGNAIRIIGEVTKEKIRIQQECDFIWLEEIRRIGRYYGIGQAFAVLTADRSVGVRGDGRAYDYVIALRSVDTTVYMTAEVTNFSNEFLKRVSSRITNEVKGVGRVVYDFTSKPPGTIEWE